jgi:hypothetical protein
LLPLSCCFFQPCCFRLLSPFANRLPFLFLPQNTADHAFTSVAVSCPLWRLSEEKHEMGKMSEEKKERQLFSPPQARLIEYSEMGGADRHRNM